MTDTPNYNNARSAPGHEVLDQVRDFLGRFISYPSTHAHVAHTLWIAHTHLMEHWDSTPRIAFLSPEPGSGKSRCLEVTEPLVPRPVHAVNATPAYLFRKVSDEAGPPTILYDEIDTVFGPKAKDNEDVRGMLNAGHRKGAIAGRCVVRGKIVETEDLPAYCAVALAGLNDLPDTIMTRSVVVRMRRRAPGERVEPWRLRINGPQAEPVRGELEHWCARAADDLDWPKMPPGIEDRDADVWEALLAVADLAGGHWPQTARVAAVALVADSRTGAPSIGVLLLTDLKSAFGAEDKMTTEAILTALHGMDERPWHDLRGKPVDSRWLSRQLKKYEVPSRNLRIGESVAKGYHATDLHDPWSRYVPDVADVADVADSTTGAPTIPAEPLTSDVADVAGPLWKLGDVVEASAEGNHDEPVGPPHRESATSATSATAEPTMQEALDNLDDLGATPVEPGAVIGIWRRTGKPVVSR